MNPVRSRTFGLIVITAALYWVTIIVLMHLSEPEFDPRRVPMSAYVLGAYGGWMRTTFFALSVALLFAGYGLLTTLPRAVLAWIAFFLFIVAALWVLVAGIFPMNSPVAPRASSGRWHALAGLFAFPAMALGPFLFSISFFRDRYWRKMAIPSSILASGIIIVFFLARFSRVAHGSGGYVQRLFFALLVPWMILVGFHLVRFRREQS